MDQRAPRPLIHNPNHQSSPSGPPPAQPTVYQPPSSQQPPVQIPFSDPFSQRRAPDPFLPNTQSQRRGSYGLSSGREPVTSVNADRNPLAAPWPPTSGASSSQPQASHQYHSATAPPPPPPLSSAHSSSSSTPYSYDSARRRSLGGHNGTETHPLPGGFGRQMPPPPQNQTHHGYAASQPPPPPPSFTSGRELPGLSSGPRPSSGFSISSILGGDPPTSQPSHSTHHSPSATTQSPGVSSMQPPSPRRGHSSSFGSFGQWRRPQTPERTNLPTGIRLQETLGQAVGTSPHPFGPSKNSPEYPRATAPYGHYPPPPPITRHAHSPPEDSRQAADRGPPRPNSQPIGYGQPLREDPYAPPPPPFGYRTSNGGSMHEQRHREEPRPPMPTAYDDRNSSPSASRDRAITVQPLGHSAYSPPQDIHRGALSRDYLRDDRIREGSPLRREDPLAGYRGYRELLREPGQGEPPRSHPSINDAFRRQSDPQEAVNALDGQQNRQLHSHPPERSYSGEYPRSSIYDQPRGAGEEMQRSRSFLGITDPSRRGRASPLPQAVQGAQPQLTGPGGDPGIKREFGAIFQGLGSGLGGHMAGSSTPSRQSPMPRRISATDDIVPIMLSDNDGTMSRTGSRGPKKTKRVKDELDGRMDLDGADGRNTPGLKGAKRTKISHHHHLPHHHHIHAHPHATDDLAILPNQSALTARFHSATPTAHHHHHHIHPPPHSHHHHFPSAPRTNSTGPAQPAPPARKPNLRISSQAVLDAVKDLPRNHIGSELYSPILEPASPQPASAAVAKGASIRRVYKPSRSFGERDWNCTFTIRIPRFYLLSKERERVCADRCLWGADVYTDDSDPLAAAVHAGWIRGAWADDIDTAQLGLAGPFPQDLDSSSSPPQSSPASMEISEPPSNGGGYLPPVDTDAHITVLILPPLKHYASAARNGVRSREWRTPHDGVSFMVVRVRWVDEGSVRGTGRSGKARREERRRRWVGGEAFRRAMRAEVEGKVGSKVNGKVNGDGGGEKMEGVEVNGGVNGTTPMAVAAAG